MLSTAGSFLRLSATSAVSDEFCKGGAGLQYEAILPVLEKHDQKDSLEEKNVFSFSSILKFFF